MARIEAVAAAVAVAAVAGWQFQDRLFALAAGPAPAAAPGAVQQKTDVLYTWVDKDGVTHFEQDSRRGTRVVYDGSRLTPVAPPAPSAGKDTAAKLQVAKEEAKQGLSQLRQELVEGAQRMQAAKDATRDF